MSNSDSNIQDSDNESKDEFSNSESNQTSDKDSGIMFIYLCI